MWKLNFRAFVQKPSTQRAVLDFSAGNFSDWRAAPVAKHTPHPKRSLQSLLQRGLRRISYKGGMLNVKPQPAVYCFKAVLTNYLKWLAAEYMLWEGIFPSKANLLSDQSCGIMTRYWTGVTKEKRYKDELLGIVETSDKILKMSKTFKLPAWSGKYFKFHICKSLSVLTLSYPSPS